jgi:hypothetical protein
MAVSEAGAREPQADSLRMEYQEVCRSHAAIKDFRAKLLALLPVATGVGVGALTISSRGRLSDIEPGLLVALGVFGAHGLFCTKSARLTSANNCATMDPGWKRS